MVAEIPLPESLKFFFGVLPRNAFEEYPAAGK
jgi:hypothetical protein